MFGPAIAALIQWRLSEHAPWSALGLQPARIRWSFMIATVLVGLCITPLTLLVMRLFGDGAGMASFGHVEVSGERFAHSIALLLEEKGIPSAPSTSLVREWPGALIVIALLLSSVVTAFTVNLPFMLGEELGWRGYLYQAVSNWSPWHRVVLIGPVWGLWHAPLIMMGHNYPGHPLLGIPVMMVFCSLLAILFDWSRARCQSVWGPCVLHGIINGSAGAFMFFAWDGHTLVASLAGSAGFIALLFLCIVVLAFDPGYRRGFFSVPPAAAHSTTNFAA
ncbi:MAG: CPBP family intramembrane metalloprotease [Flavobacteriales bacterium]|nr:CPBP family intramembrane metalloprotease [Flavobacteriales bacterium]